MKPLGLGVLSALLGATCGTALGPQIVLQQSPPNAQNGHDHSSPPSLRILLAPVYPPTSPATGADVAKKPTVPDGINVTLFLPAARFPPGVALLSLPLSAGPTPTARYDGDAISASDSRGPIQLEYIDSETSETSETREDGMRTWYPARAPAEGGDGGGVVVRFFAPARHVDNTTLTGPRIDLRRDAGGGLVGQGMGFIPVPPALTEQEIWSVTVEWDLDEAPPGTHGACSFGDDEDGGAVGVVGQLESLVTTTVFAVGQLQRYPKWQDNGGHNQHSAMGRQVHDDDEATFAMYWIGKQPYDMDVLPQQAEATYRAVAGQFLSRDPFRVFFRQVESANGGTGAWQSFLVEWSWVTADQQTRSSLLDLLAHETVHEYALLDGDFEAAWYDEGIANYYSALSLFRYAPDLGGRELLLEQLNGYSQSYYTSPVVRMGWFDALDHLWENIHITRVPYYRGFMYMAKVNGQIRAATHGAKSVDDIAQELYRRRLAGEPHGLREWHSMVAELIGEETEKAGYAELLAGDLIVPSPDCFSDLGIRLVRQDAEIFELGFDAGSLRPTSMKITNLVEGSRAEQAGVIEGDQVENAWMAWIAADTLDGTMRATIKREHSTGVVEWWPRSYEKVETWLWVAEDFGEL